MSYREETIGSARLILADCRAVMQDIACDVILTDPVWPNVPPGTIPGSDNALGLWATSCAKMPAHQRAVVVMRTDSDPRFLAEYRWLPFFRNIMLPYVMPGHYGRILCGDEYAYWFGSAPTAIRGRHLIPGRGPAAQPNIEARKWHPMPRAQVHMDWLAALCTDDGEVVLDPFMGSGTILIGAMRAGRRAIGIEIDETFFEAACVRVEESMRQGDMLIRQPEPALKQEAML